MDLMDFRTDTRRDARRIAGLLVVLALGLAATGCAHVKEAGRRVWGTSIAHLEAARQDGLALDVTLGRDAAFARAEAILTEGGAQVYLKDRDKAYLAAMGFTGYVDTTQVGLFFESRAQDATRIEVASLSPSLAERVAGLLIRKMEGQVASVRKEGGV